MPLTQYTQQINDGFNSLDQQMTKFGGSLQQGIQGLLSGGSGGGSSADGEAQSWYAMWLNSVQGTIATLSNQISEHQQALELLSDPQRIQQEIDAINSLTAEIQKLNRSVSTFNGYRSTDPIFTDPGISGTASNNTLHNTVNLSFPNMMQASQGEIDFLANQVASSLARQGSSSFHR